jgi:uncharacterized membrane protein YraQ (UPF0718 family)
MMKQTIKEALIYIFATLIIWGAISFISPTKGMLVGEVAYDAFLKALAIIIAVFIIIGLIQVWVGSQTLAKILGKESGWKGLLFSSTLPIFIGGSLFTIFPLLKTLRQKGASIACLLAFVTAWAGKAPLLPLEIRFLGWKFAVLRIGLIIPFAIVMGLLGEFILEKWQNK